MFYLTRLALLGTLSTVERVGVLFLIMSYPSFRRGSSFRELEGKAAVCLLPTIPQVFKISFIPRCTQFVIGFYLQYFWMLARLEEGFQLLL